MSTQSNAQKQTFPASDYSAVMQAIELVAEMVRKGQVARIVMNYETDTLEVERVDYRHHPHEPRIKATFTYSEVAVTINTYLPKDIIKSIMLSMTIGQSGTMTYLLTFFGTAPKVEYTVW